MDNWVTISSGACEWRQIFLLASALQACHSDTFLGLLYRSRMAHQITLPCEANSAFSSGSFRANDLSSFLEGGDIKLWDASGPGCVFLRQPFQSTHVCTPHTCTSLHCPFLIIGIQMPHEHWAEKQDRENGQVLARCLMPGHT